MRNLNQLLAWVLVSISGQLVAQSVPKTMYRLPDTGQIQSFTNTFGEDSDYSIHTPFFKVNGDGTVTDTVTGLMWQQTDGGEMTFENAQQYCTNLTLATYSDWRLPSAQEAFSILNHSKPNPALDQNAFTNTGAEYWWTSEKQADNAAKIWVTNAGGGIGNHPKSETVSAGGSKKMHARAVRDVHSPQSIAKQLVTLDSIVYDSLTGLEWQAFLPKDSNTWENALFFAENLLLEGKNDWRLPNIKELQSINDETRFQPSINPAVFKGAVPGKYWSSTSLPNFPARAWYLDTRYGIVTYTEKTAKNLILCVRGGNSATTAAATMEILDKMVFPNPFTSKIQLFPTDPEADYLLWNVYGQLIFAGKNIAAEDFSYLSSGPYFLTIGGNPMQMIRLIKS
ncbi:MAG: DUF1566 domain-containing protein [Saprospiraceae bacterium]|nr:DUF1566 domain-containing protein [Saprospiraceae bacterium]